MLNSLSYKNVKQERLNEVKKQMLSSARLKEYFNQHPKEKEIIQSDLNTANNPAERTMYKHLSFLPYYVMPQLLLTLQERVVDAGTAVRAKSIEAEE